MALAVVNARNTKQVPDRKTDINVALRPATLGRNRLLPGGFLSPRDFRKYRLMARHLQKPTSPATGEKIRLHKVLTDTDISVCPSQRPVGKFAKTMIPV